MPGTEVFLTPPILHFIVTVPLSLSRQMAE